MAIARVGASGQPIPTGGIGDILEGGGRYLGPGRLIPPAIGGGSAWGLQSLWNKITGGEDEADIVEEGEVDPTEVKDVTQDEEFEEKTGYKNIEEWLVDKGKNPDDYDEVEKEQLKKDILAQLDSIKKIRERTAKSQKIMQAYLDNLEEKHQGGLVGINELTRGLQWQ